MYNLQANGLTQALLRSNNPKLYHLCLEPFQVKKSEIKSLAVGHLLALGKELPLLYIYRKGAIVGQAELGRIDDAQVVIISAKERIANVGKPDAKYIKVESRIAILPKGRFVVGKLVALPAGSLEHVLLFVKGKIVATAKLVENTEGIFLQITEVV